MTPERIADKLADIIWWFHGYLESSQIDSRFTNIDSDHLEALRLARIEIMKKVEKE
jgi:hypothetical protein